MVNSFVNVIEAKNNRINTLERFKSDNSSFLFTISYTETATIPGLTIAGANTELIKFTPAADAEYIYFGKCKCIDTIPATPDGKPTPAIITKTALELANIPITVIDCGCTNQTSPSLYYNKLKIWKKYRIREIFGIRRRNVKL